MNMWKKNRRAKEYHNFKIKRAWLPDHPAAAHHP